ncbi:MAG: PepSY-like domain-containing protein [Saprospiraceae bacterium]|uniref:PepSY-like domain-containing protein n=1 Tax=Candidatus Opimibacter skivensis TaxID=2982028 RepID=A0A9D7XPW0_9BACT|nr:PepSY-like domain-containing protein [Candidatus Opimibacter skivensis]
MKVVLASIVFLMFTMMSCKPSEAKVNVPDAVKAKFSSMYPKAEHAEWEMEDGNYEASFKEEKMETSVIISPDGNVVETETSVDAAMLPQPVNDYVASQLGGKKISSAEKIVSATGMVSYEVEVGETDYLFDSNGQFTGKEAEEKGEEKE